MRLVSSFASLTALSAVVVLGAGAACDPCNFGGVYATDEEALSRVAFGINSIALDGATGVPLNADLWASTYGGLSGQESARLIDASVDGLGTVDVPVSAHGVGLARGALPALSPSTTYTLEFEDNGTLLTVGFTTGERDDDQDPTINGAPRVEVSDLGVGLCAAPGRSVVVSLDDVTDDTGVVAAQLFHRVDGQRQELGATLVQGAQLQLYGTLEETEGVVDLTVVVIDAAGHEASVDVEVDVGPGGLVERVEG